jgi:hypothetical protein
MHHIVFSEVSGEVSGVCDEIVADWFCQTSRACMAQNLSAMEKKFRSIPVLL